MGPIQIVLIVLIVLITAAFIYFFLSSQDAARQRAIISKIKGRSAMEGNAAMPAKGQQDKRRAEIAKKLKDSKDGQPEKNKKKPTISLLIEQSGMRMTMVQFWILSVAAMVILTLGAKLTGQGNLVMGLCAVIGFFGVPRFILKRAAAKRQKKFLMEFPDALESTVRLLKAGMPVAEAILMIAREFSGPVGEEMSIVYDKQKIGVPLHEAALEATRRMPLTEMQMFATGLSIQAQTGSSLSEVLTNLSNVIRSRFKLKRKIKALSSEAISSASIIAALPCFVAGGMYAVNYEYIAILFHDPFGNVLLGGAIFWMFIGVMVMKAMINFKI